MLNCSPKAAAKLLFIQEMHRCFTKMPFAYRADPPPCRAAKCGLQSRAQWSTRALCSHLFSAMVEATCASPAGYHQARESSRAPSPAPEGTEPSLVPQPEPSTHLCLLQPGFGPKGPSKDPSADWLWRYPPNTPIYN